MFTSPSLELITLEMTNDKTNRPALYIGGSYTHGQEVSLIPFFSYPYLSELVPKNLVPSTFCSTANSVPAALPNDGHILVESRLHNS
jgi:hypothetical protein